MKVAEKPDFLQSVMDDPRVSPWIAQDDCEVLPLSLIFDDGIGLEFLGHGDAGGAIFGFADDDEVGLVFDEAAETAADERVVVDEEDGDAWVHVVETSRGMGTSN